MPELDFSLGQARTPLNLQAGITTYFQAQANKRANVQSRRLDDANKKQEFIRGLVSKNTDPTGQLDREGLIRGMMQRGYLTEVNQIKSDFIKQDGQMAKAKAAKSQAENKMMGRYAEHYLTSSDKHNSFGDILGDMTKRGMQIPRQWQDKTSADPDVTSEMEMIFTQYADEAAKKRLQSVTAPARKPLTEKEVLEEGRREKLAALSEEFRQTFLPNLDISRLATDKNARNQLVKQINESKFWNTPLAKQTIKGLRGKTTNLAEQLGSLLTKQNISEVKLTGAEAEGLGSIEPAVTNMNILVDMYQKGDTGTFSSTLASAASDVPYFGQRVFKEAAEFNAHKKIMAEGFLRAATGAAAPDKEVATYQGFLPKWGDSPKRAQAALDSFMGKIRAEAFKSVSRLRALNTPESLAKAERIQAKVEKMLSQVKPIVPAESGIKRSTKSRKQYNY